MSPSRRDHTIDALRGLCLLIMLIDHLPMNPLRRFTFHPFGFFNAACIFVLLAGYVGGWLFTRQADRTPWLDVRTRILRRAATLWLVHVAIVTGLLAVLVARLEPGKQVAGGIVAFFLRELTIWSRLEGILPIYVVVLPLLVFIVPAFRSGRQEIVFRASFGTWALTQLLPPVASNNYNVLSWQILFVFGSWLGYCRATGRSLAVGGRTRLWLVAAAVGLFLLRHLTPLEDAGFAGIGFSLTTLGAVRLLNVIVVALLVLSLPSTWVERLRASRIVALPAVLGRQSLPVYALHYVPVVALEYYASVGLPVVAGSVLWLYAVAGGASWLSRRQTAPKGSSSALEQPQDAPKTLSLGLDTPASPQSL